jgi:bifunctional ADP-heptose synthase (sugar kinase/adenylyltransferase)
VIGGDYTAETLNTEEREVLEKTGAKIEIIPFEQGYSTSELLEKIKGCGS